MPSMALPEASDSVRHAHTNGFAHDIHQHAPAAGNGAQVLPTPASSNEDTTFITSNSISNTLPNGDQQPIAIIGMSCRLPGDVTTPEKLWELCSRARTGWSEIPADRWNSSAFRHPNPSKKGCYNPTGGHFLTEDVGLFDAPFFNITAQEATSMDPQHRLLLECTYEALDSAGIPKEQIAGQPVGVFVGDSFADYEINNVRDSDSIPMFQATGCAGALMSNRVSYSFDLKGPSFTVDTACSSSLTGLHLAAQSLRSGECTQAIVGGSHLNLLPDFFITMSMSQLFNETGQSFPFDSRATSGFGRGEGVGVVILKPLADAIRDNDAIRSVIVGTGINQDGRTPGITQPNGTAQEDLIRSVYRKANIKMADVAFVEAHGTGTKVGDPIEAKAIASCFGENRTARKPLYLGSIKSNIGHLEGTSGVVSLIKASMMIEKGLLLPNANYDQPNPNIPLKEWNMKVLSSVRPFPPDKSYVSLNNFGFGGGNAHAVVGRVPPLPKLDLTSNGDDLSDQHWRLFALTANDKQTLIQRMKELGIYLEQKPEVFQKALGRNLAFTLGLRRSHLQWRVFYSANSSDDLGIKLAKAALAPVRASGEPGLGFIFTGQGAQWHAMGRELSGAYAVFAEALTAADQCLKSLGAKFSLLDELNKDAKESIIDQPHMSQPACTAIQIALVNLFRSWNIHPRSVAGHSSGEIGAAYAAGMLSLESSMALAYHRGRATIVLKEQNPDLKGAMLAVGGGEADVRPLLKGLTSGYATIACINSPSSVTVSGDDAAIAELQPLIEAKSMFNRRLRVNVAYHSEHMGRVAEDYRKSIENIMPIEKSNVVFHSSLLGRVTEAAELGPQYWVKNLVNPVQFTAAIESMCNAAEKDIEETKTVNTLVEFGPHAALEGPVRDIIKRFGEKAKRFSYIPTLIRNKDATEAALNAAGTLWQKGYKVDFKAINLPKTNVRLPSLLTDLPKYPFNHDTKYWHESRISKNHCFRPFPRNDLVGMMAAYSSDLEPTWRNIIRLDDLPWLRHHKMQSMNVYPIAGYIAMALEASSQRAQMRDVKFDRFELREIIVSRPLIIDEDEDVEAMITLKPYAEGLRSYSDSWDEFRISSWHLKKGYTEHARGLVGVRHTAEANAVDGARQITDETESLRAYQEKTAKSATTPVNVVQMYETLSHAGAGYGETFQGLSDATASDEYAVATLTIPDTASIQPKEFQPDFIVHPSTFDIFIQVVWPLFGAGRTGMDNLFMPSSIKKLSIARDQIKTPGKTLRVYSHRVDSGLDLKPRSFDIMALNAEDDTKPCISIKDLVMTPLLESGASSLSSQPRGLCFKTILEPAFPPAEFGISGISEKDQMAAIDGMAHDPMVNGSHLAHEHIDGSNGVINGISNGNIVAIPNGISSNGVSNDVSNDVSKDVSKDVSNGVSNGVTTATTNGSHCAENGASVTSAQDSNGGSGHTNGHANGHANGHTNGTNGHATSGILKDNIVILGTTSATHDLAGKLADALSDMTGKRPEFGQIGAFDVTGKLCIILSELEKPILNELDSQSFQALQKTLISAEGLLWVTRGAYANSTDPTSNMIAGLSRAIRSETLAQFITLDLDPQSASDVSGARVAILDVLRAKWSPSPTEGESDMEYIERSGKLLVPRVVPDEETNSLVHRQTQKSAPYLQSYYQVGRRLKLEIEVPGALDTLYFVDEEEHKVNDDEVEIEVKATGMNFKDIVVSMGTVSQPYIGVECSGIITSIGCDVSHLKIGDRVMAMSEGAYSTFAHCKATSVAKIPDEMSFAAASTVPVVFCTAYYGLYTLARLEEGERVLIHAAAGGVGQAAIILAKLKGAEIFATVGSADKKDFVMKEYGIPDDHIFYSRDTSFGPALRRATGGQGVDVVLNSLAGDLLRETWASLSHFGRFIEIGKRDIVSNTRLEMAQFETNTTFSSVDLTLVAKERPRLMHKLLTQVTELFFKGSIRAISPVTVYPISDVESAFRKLQSGKAMGKLVVVANPSDKVRAMAPKPSSDLLRQDASYLLIGGTGGLGRSIARWMSSKGARCIVLLSRSGKITGQVSELINELVGKGTKVVVRACDVANKQHTERLIKEELKDLPPVRGVIHGAMVLRDILFEKMTFEDYHEVIQSKVNGTWNIHNALLDSSLDLDFFIALSSVAGVVGNRGQANYAAANTFLDAFVQYRNARGLPATSLDLTAVSDIGYLAENVDKQKEVARNLGGETIEEVEIMALIGAAIKGELKLNCNSQCTTGLGVPEGFLEKLFWINDAKFSQLRETAIAAAGDRANATENGQIPLSQAIKLAKSRKEAFQPLLNALIGKLGAVLMVPAEDLDPQKAITTLGLDSLVAIEIRNYITREMEANLQILEILTSASINALAETIMTKSPLFAHLAVKGTEEE